MLLLLKLGLDVGLVTYEEEAPLLVRRVEEVAPVGDPLPHDARFRRREVGARSGLADVRGVRAPPLEGVARIIEVVVAVRAPPELEIVDERRQRDRRAALPAADHPRREQVGVHSEPRRLRGYECLEGPHVLLELAEDHVGSVGHPGEVGG